MVISSVRAWPAFSAKFDLPLILTGKSSELPGASSSSSATSVIRVVVSAFKAESCSMRIDLRLPSKSIRTEVRVMGDDSATALDVKVSCALHDSPALLSLVRNTKPADMRGDAASCDRSTDGFDCTDNPSRDCDKSYRQCNRLEYSVVTHALAKILERRAMKIRTFVHKLPVGSDNQLSSTRLFGSSSHQPAHVVCNVHPIV